MRSYLCHAFQFPSVLDCGRILKHFLLFSWTTNLFYLWFLYKYRYFVFRRVSPAGTRHWHDVKIWTVKLRRYVENVHDVKVIQYYVVVKTMVQHQQTDVDIASIHGFYNLNVASTPIQPWNMADEIVNVIIVITTLLQRQENHVNPFALLIFSQRWFNVLMVISNDASTFDKHDFARWDWNIFFPLFQQSAPNFFENIFIIEYGTLENKKSTRTLSNFFD